MHLEVGWQVRALKQTFRLPQIQACRYEGTKNVGASRRRGFSFQVQLLLLNHLPDSKTPSHSHHYL